MLPASRDGRWAFAGILVVAVLLSAWHPGGPAGLYHLDEPATRRSLEQRSSSHGARLRELKKRLGGVRLTLELRADGTLRMRSSTPGLPEKRGGGTWSADGDVVTIVQTTTNGRRLPKPDVVKARFANGRLYVPMSKTKVQTVLVR